MFGESSKTTNPFYIIVAFLVVAIFLMIPPDQGIEAHGPMGWKAPAKEKRVKNLVPSTRESRNRGQKIYADKCTLCHGLKGDAQRGADFTDLHMMKEMTDGKIIWKINTGKGQMPSYQKELTEEERWDLVNYIRSFAKPK